MLHEQGEASNHSETQEAGRYQFGYRDALVVIPSVANGPR